MIDHQEIEDYEGSVSDSARRAKPMSWAMKAVCFVIGFVIALPIAILVILAGLAGLDYIATYIY